MFSRKRVDKNSIIYKEFKLRVGQKSIVQDSTLLQTSLHTTKLASLRKI